MNDPKYLSAEEIRNLSTEEKREFVRSLIHSEAVDVRTAFFNPQTKQRVELKDLVEQIGEEKTIELLVKAFEDETAGAMAATSKDFRELLEKAERGECTEEELGMLDFIRSTMEQDEMVQVGHCYLDAICSVTDFAQTDLSYEPTYSDFLSSISIFVMVSLVHSEDNALSKYSDKDAPLVAEMVNQIGTDIYDTWKDSCSELPEPELIVAGLILQANKIASEAGLKLPKAIKIANALGISLVDSNDSDDDTTNGSNEEHCCDICQPNIYKSSSKNDEDKEMRDLLKE